jgi:hypothetical protein
METTAISLNSLLGEEYSYCNTDPAILANECMTTLAAIEICQNNIIALEAAKSITHTKHIDGGTGPLPTNTKYDTSDYHSDVNRKIIVDFEEKIVVEKKNLWQHIKILLQQVREWIESIIYRIISFVRHDKAKINDVLFMSKLKDNIAKNIKVKTYPFERPPEDIVSDCIRDINRNVISAISEVCSKKNLQADYTPFFHDKILGININHDDNDILEKLKKKMLGGTLGVRPIMNAHITEESFLYFINDAPGALKEIQRSWHQIEREFSTYEIAEERLSEVRRVVLYTQKSINAALSTINMLIFHMSSLMHIVEKQ